MREISSCKKQKGAIHTHRHQPLFQLIGLLQLPEEPSSVSPLDYFHRNKKILFEKKQLKTIQNCKSLHPFLIPKRTSSSNFQTVPVFQTFFLHYINCSHVKRTNASTGSGSMYKILLYTSTLIKKNPLSASKPFYD